jgi:hypothetical protein
MSVRTLASIVGVCALVAVAGSIAWAKNSLEVRARDQCDPTTFNAGRATPLCTGSNTGSVTLQQFQNALPNGGEGHWKFNPGPSGNHVDNGGSVLIVSDGGETHTFTRVAQFGGGFVAGLNVAVGNAATVPECAAHVAGGPLHATPQGAIVAADTQQSVRAGGTLLPPGTHHFQCCIHPWMRTTITVR